MASGIGKGYFSAGFDAEGWKAKRIQKRDRRAIITKIARDCARFSFHPLCFFVSRSFSLFPFIFVVTSATKRNRKLIYFCMAVIIYRVEHIPAHTRWGNTR